MRKIVFYNKTVNFNSPVVALVKRAAALLGKKRSRPIHNEGRSQDNQKSAVSVPQKPSADVKPDVTSIIEKNPSTDNNAAWGNIFADAQKPAVSVPQKPLADVKPKVASIIGGNTSTEINDTWNSLYADAQKPAVPASQKPSADASTDNDTVWANLYADVQKPAVSVPKKPFDSVPNSNNPGRRKRANIDSWDLLWKGGSRLFKGNYSRRSFNYSRVFLI
jgi:hypothetical protein